MPTTITSDTEVEWTISLNAGEAADRVLAATKVDLLSPEEDPAGIHRLQHNMRDIIQVVWALVEPVAKERQVSESAWKTSFSNPSKIKEAWIEELQNFIQMVSPTAHVRMVETRRVDSKMQEKLQATLQSEDLHNKVEGEVDQVIAQEVANLSTRISEAVANAE